MAQIRLLDESTANQIAAGEVVERPASVVKELVENSLDADSSRIVVEVEGGGKKLIRVTDDGTGMTPEDAALALQRHATSKIRTAADLQAVTTMGFRGEAIPSIASVSRFELVTRERNALAGYRIYVEGGRIVEQGEFGAPPGTRVTVEDLFFNVPARLKYLKTNTTEMGQIGDMLTRLALANPHVAMRFHSGPTQVFATPGTGDLMDAAAALLGRELTRELLPVEYEDPYVRITGYVGRPSAARAGRNHQYFFVNRRAIRQIQARYALEEAYAHLLTKGRYPVCILFLEVPPHEVDVNVHPAKAEVRFERDREVRAAVYKAARQSLGAHLLIPGTTVTSDGEVLVPDRAGEKAAAQRGEVPPGATPGALPGGGPAGQPGAGSWSGARDAAPDLAGTANWQGAGERGMGDAQGSREASLGDAAVTGPATPAARGWIPPGARRPGEGGGRASLPPWMVGQNRPAPGAARQVSFKLENAQTNPAVADPAEGYGTLPPGGLAAVLEERSQGAGAVPPQEMAEEHWTAEPAPLDEAALIRSLRPLGQIHRSYIVCDGPEGLYVIDQHAAHERIFFERLYAAAQETEAPVQPLLFPIALDLTPAQMALWQENQAIFQESGLMAEPFGGTTLLIKGMPADLGEAHAARLVSDFLDRLQEEQVPTGAPVLERRQRVLAAMAACKAAIKARDALQPEEIQALLNDLAACASPTTCPHGRPTLVCIGTTELEKRFKR